LKKVRLRKDKIHVSRHRLDDDAGYGVVLESLTHLIDIVEIKNQRVRGGIGRYAGRAGVAEGERPRSRLHEQRVRMSVVAAFELDDEIAPGEAAREANGGHRRLGAGRDEAHHV